PAADPQLAVHPVAEEVVGVPWRAWPYVQHRLPAWPDDQYRVRVVLAGQVREVAARPEPVVRVVGPDRWRTAGDDQRVAGERLGDRGPALGVLRRLGKRRHIEGPVPPAGTHEL